MTGLIIALASVILLACAGYRIEALHSKIEDLRETDHTRCVVAVGDRHEANVLRLAAVALDSPEGRYEARVIAQRWDDQGPSPVAMWLNARADKAEERSRA